MKIGTLFSGIGAPEYALKSLKIKHSIEFACDNDPYVKKTYLANHDCNIWYDDVFDIKRITPVDLLIYGFPCQPFSIAGKRKGFNDPRGKPLYKVLDLMKRDKPRMFIAENVVGFKTIDNGRALDYLLEEFRKMGYTVKYATLNSLNFGIPQSRNRLWIVGTLDKSFDFQFPIGKNNTPPLSDFLDRNVEDNVYATPEFLNKSKVQDRMYNYKDPYVTCITKTLGRNGSSGEYISNVAAVHNAIGESRKTTVQETLRLFGFPSNFYFPESVSTTHRYDMLANSMVVPVVGSIIKNLIEG